MKALLVLLTACSARLGDPSGAVTSGSDLPTGVIVDAGAHAVPPDAPIALASCCHDRGHCVANIENPFIDRDSCDDGQACVPDQLLDQDPIAPCTATTDSLGTYTGVCLSDCLHFGAAQLAIDRGDCANHYECVPCLPGVPGCI
ncbi:MAG TPA: hypothetical protein VGC41_03855 [Kofleriaceae bacterium]